MFLIYELQKDDSAREYYQLTKGLAVQLQKQMKILDKPLEAFHNFIQAKNIEPVREIVEYGIELLDFAILHRWIQNLSVQRKFSFHKVTYTSLKESFLFMQESGEFKEEIYRFQNWLDFFAGYEEMGWKELWSSVCTLIETVDKLGDCYLQKYLLHLPNYLEANKTAWNNRTDAGLILRDKSCYYINMIAAQMLNACYKEDFSFCDKVYIFLPGCMAEKMDKCQAKESKEGYICASCSQACQINSLSKQHSGVRIVYHGSQMEKKKVNKNEKIGVIGVACILNLISGGWKARRLGYIPQCVILNECGCNIHWDEKGRITSLDEKELQRLLER